MRVVALLLLVLTGCANTRAARFADDAVLRFDRSRYVDDAAVVLLREDRTNLVTGSGTQTLYARHEVIAILGEGGRWLGQVKVPFRANWRFDHFAARIVRPDGTREEFTDTALLSDTSGKGEQDSNARFFTFPNVTVGSVIEYEWAVEAPHAWGYDSQDTLGRYPVKEYRFELKASKPLQLETIVMNGGVPIEVRTASDGSHTLRFELRDLPTRVAADAAPHWTFTEPRWAWRVLGYRLSSYSQDWYRDWSDVLNSLGDAFFTAHKLQRGFDAKLDTAGCEGATCWAERALTLVKAQTSTHGIDWNRAEPLVDAWNSGKASGVERALMVKELLVKQGLDVWLAYSTGKLDKQTMSLFPNFEQFTRLFVYVPKQRGVKEPLLLDPACDACSATQTEARFTYQPVYVFKTTQPMGTPTTRGRWERVELDAAPTRFTVKHVATLRPSGDLADTLTVEARGTATTGALASYESEKFDLLRDSRDRARRSSPIAEVDAADWRRCTPQACDWEVHAYYPAEAAQDGARYLVPTTFLRDSLEEYLLAKKRYVDLHFDNPDLFEEVAELTVPENLKLLSVPAPVSLEVDGYTVKVRFEPTPTGVRISRSLEHGVIAISKKRYEDVQAAVEAFRRARREVLVFAPKQ